MALVYASSTQLGTYDRSLNLMLRASHWIAPDLPIPQDVGEIFLINNAVRKLAHVVAFGGFTLLLVRALQWGNPRLKKAVLPITFGLGLLFSFSDALFRIYAPSRHVRGEQFVLNALGSAIVLILVVLFFAAKRAEAWLLAGNYSRDGEKAGNVESLSQ